MAALTTERRKSLGSNQFVFPQTRAYPIDTAARARNALSRGSQNASPEQLAKIKAAVSRRYPGIKIAGLMKKKRGKNVKAA